MKISISLWKIKRMKRMNLKIKSLKRKNRTLIKRINKMISEHLSDVQFLDRELNISNAYLLDLIDNDTQAKLSYLPVIKKIDIARAKDDIEELINKEQESIEVGSYESFAKGLRND
jgi:hypothetical protein